jgi:hypothetical protein
MRTQNNIEMNLYWRMARWQTEHSEASKDKVKVIIRPTVSRPVCLGVRDPRPISLLLSLIIFRQLRVCCCVGPSLTIGRVCSFQLLLDIARVWVLRVKNSRH